MKKALATLGILIIMFVAIVGTVSAQSEDPTATPTATPTGVETTEVPTTEATAAATAVPTVQPGAKFFTHPVVQVLSAYFDRPRETNPNQWVTPVATVDPLATPDPSATAVAPVSESGLGPIGEEIAAYHEEGMGFGVLVKVYAMVEASQEACGVPSTPPVAGQEAAAEECTPLTADELVTSLQSGTGMGQLFKEYGKPALLGVGHVKQKVKEMGSQPEPQSTEVVSTPEAGIEETPSAMDALNGKGKKPLNGKGNNGKGNNGKGPNK